MSKKDDRDETKGGRTGRGGRMPPPLGTDLIAKLQAAVDAARRRRLRTPQANSEPEPEPSDDR